MTMQTLMPMSLPALPALLALPALPAPLLPPDHPDRAALAAEVHARPPEPLAAPCRASYVAVRIAHEARPAERAHLARLCQYLGCEPPSAERTHWAATLGALRFKWERHGEFSSYTCLAGGLGPLPFHQPAATLLPEGWLATSGRRAWWAPALATVPAAPSPTSSSRPTASRASCCWTRA